MLYGFLRKLSRLILSMTIAIPLMQSISAVGVVRAAPPSTPSWYVSTANLTTWYKRGCDLGAAVLAIPGTQTSVVSLGFGRPSVLPDGSSGASFYGNDGTGVPAGIGTAISVADSFARGYYTCTQADTTSLLYLSMGTSNDGSHVTATHGHDWASGPVWEDSVLAGRTAHWQTYVFGGIDVEPPSGGNFNTFQATKPWLDAYDAYPGRRALYANAACFASPTGTYAPTTSCGVGWTVDNMDYAVFRLVAAFPLPQIYHVDGSDAAIWYRMDKYHTTYYAGTRYIFAGVMSQQAACNQVGGCGSANLAPADAWDYLQWDVNTDTATSTTIRPPTDVRWS